MLVYQLHITITSSYDTATHYILPRCCTLPVEDKKVRLELYTDNGDCSSSGGLVSKIIAQRDGIAVVYDFTFTGSFEFAQKLVREIVQWRNDNKVRNKMSYHSCINVANVHYSPSRKCGKECNNNIQKVKRHTKLHKHRCNLNFTIHIIQTFIHYIIIIMHDFFLGREV